MKISLFQKVVRIALSFALVTVAIPALAWTGPTAAPPGANVSAPVNLSTAGQTKAGYLGVGGGAPSYPLSVAGAAGNWSGVFNWPPASAPAGSFGILVGAANYSQFQNSAGYYTLLAQSSNGVNTNGNIIASTLYSGGGGSFFASNGDQYMGYSGYYLSTLLGWNGSGYNILSGNQGHKFGGGFGTGPYGCYIGNNFTGGCSCPGFAPYAQLITNQNDRTGTWYAGYTCYGA
jgi:hypothetical protein